MAFLVYAQALLSTLSRTTLSEQPEKLRGKNQVYQEGFTNFRNAFVTATLNSPGELTSTSVPLLFEKTQIIMWNSKILKTKRDGENAIF